jgi:hypothetical protein
MGRIGSSETKKSSGQPQVQQRAVHSRDQISILMCFWRGRSSTVPENIWLAAEDVWGGEDLQQLGAVGALRRALQYLD